MADNQNMAAGGGEIVGARIGPYRILRELGRGGMGAVYLAERADDQFRKTVAFKLVKRGMDTDEVLVRFRRERQILASLDHPNIARVLDGGVTPDGLPYFAMEYIEGLPIHQYCQKKGLGIKERLRLFQKVCAAVQYAHQNLVVHRDIKPGNILISEGGVVKLLDFGIAKLLNPEEFPETVMPTHAWERPMTPRYASPEQAIGQNITTSSDVYSLGVVLYELLTGQLPYRFTENTPSAIAEVICAAHPEKPSEAAPPARRELAGDLDNITLMALRKEPQRRYASAEQLSEDIRRHLDGLPVIAREDTFRYRAGKFVQRHKAMVAVAAVFSLMLAAFLITLVIQSRRISQERDVAQQERDKAQKVSSFLIDLFKVNEPGESRGNQVTARQLLDRGAAQIEASLQDKPEVRATLMQTMGSAYSSLGLYSKSRPLLEGALGARRAAGSRVEDVMESLLSLSNVEAELGNAPAAEAKAREALEMGRKNWGGDHEATAAALGALGYALYMKRDYAAGEPCYREAIAMQTRLKGTNDARVAFYEDNLGVLMGGKGNFTEAEALHRHALEVERRLLGDEHPSVVSALNNLAVELLNKKDFRAAEPTFRELVKTGGKIYGEDNPHVGLYLANLGFVLSQVGKIEEAEQTMRRSLDVRRKSLPEGNPAIGHSGVLLGRLLLNKGEPQQAEPYLREAVKLFRASFAPGNLMTADAENTLGACLMELRRWEEAEKLLTLSYTTIRGANNSSRLSRTALERMVKFHETRGNTAKAGEYRRLLR